MQFHSFIHSFTYSFIKNIHVVGLDGDKYSCRPIIFLIALIARLIILIARIVHCVYTDLMLLPL